MPKLIFYNSDGELSRIDSSSRPKNKWDLRTYGLKPNEAIKLFDESELPWDFEQHKYIYSEALESLVPNPKYIDPTPPLRQDLPSLYLSTEFILSSWSCSIFQFSYLCPEFVHLFQ